MNLITFFSSLNTTQIGIVLFSLLVVGLYIGINVLINLRREHRNLRFAETELDRFSSEKETGQDGSSLDILTFGLSTRIKKNVGGKSNSLTWERVRVLEQVKENSGRFDRTSISEVTRSRLRAQTASLRYIAGILILIGLFGTLCGLTGAVSGLGGAVDSSREQQFQTSDQVDIFISNLRDEIGTTLGGMQMAFMASLLGVFSTIILTGFVSFLNRQQLKFLAELEDFTTIKLMPHYLPKGEASSLQNIADHFHENAIQLEKVFNKFKVDYEQKNKIVSGVGTITEAINNLVNVSHKREEEIYNALGENINKLSESAAGSYEAFQATEAAIRNLETTMKSVTEGEISTRNNFLKTMGESFKGHNEKLETIFAKISDAFKGQFKQTEQSVNQVKESSGAIQKTLELLIEIERDNKNALAQLTSAMNVTERFDELNRQMQEQNKLMNDAFGSEDKENNINSSLKQVNESIQKLEKGSAETLNKIINESKSNEKLEEIQGQLKEQTSILAAAFSSNGKTENGNSILKEINSSLTANFGKIQNGINALPNTIQNLVEVLQKPGRGKRTSKSQNEDLNENLSELIDLLNDYIYLHENRGFINFVRRLLRNISIFFKNLKYRIVGEKSNYRDSRHDYNGYDEDFEDLKNDQQESPTKVQKNKSAKNKE